MSSTNPSEPKGAQQQEQSGANLPPPLPPEDNNQPPSNASNRTKNPKDYERVIARWTLIVGIFTGLLVLATGISAYFLFKTDETLQQTLSQQTRPYVGMKGFGQIAVIPADKNGELYAAIPAIWTNSGNTQAENLVIVGSCGKDEAWVPDQGIWMHTKWSLSPKSDWPFIQCWPKISELSDYKNNKFLYVFGQAEYIDQTVSGGRHAVTRFCARLSTFRAAKGPLGEDIFVPLINSCVGPGNCSDEECAREDQRGKYVANSRAIAEAATKPEDAQ